MAGEAVLAIKKTEEEANQIINNARNETKRIIQNARKKGADFIRDKDELLKKEEIRIRESYSNDTKKVLRKLEDEEMESVERVNKLCEKNFNQVVPYISGQIIKE